MDVIEAIRTRISANRFDPARTLSRDEILDLVALALEAPSSFNIQHTRFLAVVEKADKERLKAAAYGQQKVADAAVTFVVLGDLRGQERLPEIGQRCVEAGVVGQELVDQWVEMANAKYSDEQEARDEAIRSASLAAMSLMLAAHGRGLVSGPMIGFDAHLVMSELDIPDRYVPVMLLAVGYEAPGNWPRKPRLGAAEVLAFHRSPEF